MTPGEFNEQYEKLVKHYPLQFKSEDRCNSLAKEVSDLSAEWFEGLVTKIIAGNDPYIRLHPLIDAERERVRAEKRRENVEHNSTEQAKEYQAMREKMSGDSLEKLKREHGVEKASELIGKVRVV